MKIAIQLSLLLLGLAATRVSAQVINAKSDFTQPVDIVLCEGTGSFTLTASTDAGGGLVYDSNLYEWVDVTGGNTPLPATTNALSLVNLGPGYHTYRVRGTVSGANTCPGDFQEYSIYVLPKLEITIASSGSAAGNSFCADALPASVDLTATVVQKDPVPETFGFSYQWFKVEGGTETAIPGATNSSYSVTALALGDVTYKVKTTFKVDPTCSTDSSSGADGAVNIVVKPRPVKPTITFSRI